MTAKPQRIAVVGSGIGGLVAAWITSRRHHVTLYEAHPALGMDAFAATYESDGKTYRTDVPMRVFFDAYYPQISRLYKTLGIQSDPINYAASFTKMYGDLYFQYRNLNMLGMAVPFLSLPGLLSSESRRIGLDFLKLVRRMTKDLETKDLDHVTLEEYLAEVGVSRAFCDKFLYPAYAGICTCSYQSMRQFPASIVIEYLNSGIVTTNVRRVRYGTKDVVARFTEHVKELKLSNPVQGVRRREDHVELVEVDGTLAQYDHVVFATQANQADKILADQSPAERAFLKAFHYESFPVVMHTDTRLAPRVKAYWSPVNYLLKEGSDAPMATIWLNACHERMGGNTPIFQTWNPLIDPLDGTVISQMRFERPRVDHGSLQALKSLDTMMAEPDRRVWFCGSYAHRGIPLLESGAVSAIRVGKKLGCSLPAGVETEETLAG
ncbi:NAD(P)-binding protein [Acanthopleuribacter pedis]|uniref:NAD(P)-binding protein n=1 Tax=Acanthopleuribacter pedis TaxID=442870 RepID=A0A8J7Q697_9BACT|nr:NAD(P)-binding protein [Acanthopleuribacter pedis]MBO1317449.1 NAD(P)-binding protein [Acanthopleuribacter pedis]